VLNTAWEFVQCPLLYDMWTWGFGRAALWMWGAILGDVVIVMGVAYLAFLIVGTRHMVPPDRKGWTALLAVGVVASVSLEWMAKVLDLWSYSALMPTFSLFDYTVGLSPVLQVMLLPTLSVYLATRNRKEKTREDGQARKHDEDRLRAGSGP
jgi:hypothetical protein